MQTKKLTGFLAKRGVNQIQSENDHILLFFTWKMKNCQHIPILINCKLFWHNMKC